MDLLTAALACSLHHDPALVRALVEVQSEGHRFFVGDFEEMRGNGTAKDAGEAGALVKQVQGKHHALGVGLLGIPFHWAVDLDRPEDDLWDGCGNIAIGTTRLAEFDYQCRGRQVKAWRRGAARRPPPAVSSAANRVCVVKKFAGALGLPSTFLTAVFKAVFSASAGDVPRTESADSEKIGADAEEGWDR
jgi:hypothetical protein